MQPLVRVSIGDQWLNLVFDASTGDTVAFVKERGACVPPSLAACYSHEEAEKNGTLHVCAENMQTDCLANPYTCDKYLGKFMDAKEHQDTLVIDGLEYVQKAVEAKDDVLIPLAGGLDGAGSVFNTTGMAVRLLVDRMRIPTPHSWISLDLFRGVSGILGASGPSLSCRKQTFWNALLDSQGFTTFALDMRPPPNATTGERGDSRVVFNEVDPEFAPAMVWSQPKQTGDLRNDGMHEFLMYHVGVCGVDLLYNTSSNWLTVIDTSGPCLLLPPFLFDRLMSRIPVECPFASGERSLGRLCSPKRGMAGAGNVTLPSLYFQLEDARDPSPPKLHLPLERLVFRNHSGAELLCVSRDDIDAQSPLCRTRNTDLADMTCSHIALGSLAFSALYAVVNLENRTVGMASKGDLARESTDGFCVPSVTCKSPMQTYFPPSNVCEDPRCSDYMFMTLDEATKTCKWSRAIPVLFGLLLLSLVVLDLVSHRLYKQAIEKASLFCT